MQHQDSPHVRETVTGSDNTMLVHAVKNDLDNGESFAKIFHTYQGLVRNCLIRYGVHSNDLDDCMQEVFIIAFRKIGNLREPEALPGWLKSITRSTAINYLIRKRCAVMFSELDFRGEIFEPESRTQTPQQILMEQESGTAATMDCILAALKPLDRQMAEEFYVQGLSIREMTLIPDCDTQRFPPEGTIKRRLHDIRRKVTEIVGSNLGSN